MKRFALWHSTLADLWVRIKSVCMRGVFLLWSAGRAFFIVAIRFADHLFCALYIYRVPLIVAILAFVVLLKPAQTMELFLLLAEDRPLSWFHAVVCGLLVALLSFVLLIIVQYNSIQTNRSPKTRTFKFIELFVGLICSILPIVAMQSATASMTSSRTTDKYAEFYHVYSAVIAKYPDEPQYAVIPERILEGEKFYTLPVLALNLIGILAITFFLTPYSRRLASRSGPRSSAHLYRSRLYKICLVFTVVAIVVFALPQSWAVPSNLVEIPRFIGALSIIVIFLILFAAHLAALSEVADKSGYPLVSSLFVAAVLFSYFDLNDNHAIRSNLVSSSTVIPYGATNPLDLPPEQFDGSAGTRVYFDILEDGTANYSVVKEPTLAYFEENFANWIAARPKEVKRRFAGSKYPVYIVSAEGGGIYAATEAAIALARLFDRCPRLVHHVFAISSVSGGSYGSAIVAALIQARERQLGPKARQFFLTCPGKAPPLEERFFENSAMDVLSSDHLSPAIAAALFPDFLQRFLPVKLDILDRARAFERSIEESWETSGLSPGFNPFERDFRELWTSTGVVPMLMLNTTTVERGIQAVIAPFETPYSTETRHGRIYSFFGHVMSPRYDLPLSTAVGLSARFIALAPPGHHVDLDAPRPLISPKLVDGGYVENSGIETALAAARTLDFLIEYGYPELVDQRRAPVDYQKYNVKLHLLFIGQTSVLDDFYGSDVRLDEVGGPFLAMYNSRVFRSHIAIRNALEFDPDAATIGLLPDYYSPPLGWHISKPTVRLIGAYLGFAEMCGLGHVHDPKSLTLGPRVVELFGSPWWTPDPYDLIEKIDGNHCAACSAISVAQGRSTGSSKVLPKCDNDQIFQ